MGQRWWSLQPGNLSRVHQALAKVHKFHGENLHGETIKETHSEPEY